MINRAESGREPISTGISGLDEVLGGGLTADRLYLVEGTPGTGKTTLSLQFLMEGGPQGRTNTLRHLIRKQSMN